MSEIKFHEVVKMIHPDVHPEIKDASIKMSLVVKYKNDPLALWNLCVKWKLVKGEYNISAPEAVVPITITPVVNTTPNPYDEWIRRFTRPVRPNVHTGWVELNLYDKVVFNRQEGIIVGIVGTTFTVVFNNRVIIFNRHDRYEDSDFKKGSKPSNIDVIRANKVLKQYNSRKKFWNFWEK